ncbi:MAG: hypothetical protein KJ709_03440 [Nanoarchaeota archaeon]|nr:hypothetical protein [Nanoarchaeota archaeon]
MRLQLIVIFCLVLSGCGAVTVDDIRDAADLIEVNIDEKFIHVKNMVRENIIIKRIELRVNNIPIETYDDEHNVYPGEEVQIEFPFPDICMIKKENDIMMDIYLEFRGLDYNFEIDSISFYNIVCSS